MAFNLNTQSWTLHMDDHGGGMNADEFDRADAADKFAHDSGQKMTFCKQCFPGNRNTLQADALAEAEEAMATPDRTPPKATGSPTENTRAAGTDRPVVNLPNEDGDALN